MGIGSQGSAITAATAPSVQAMSTATPAFDDTFAGVVSGLLAAPCTALATASQPTQAPAIGAGPAVTVAAATVDPDVAAAALLSVAAALAASTAAAPHAQAIALSAQMQAAAQAASAGATIPFASTEDAAAWRDTLDAALAALQARAASLAATLPLTAGPAWRAILTVRSQAYADCNARAVNLPSLITTTTAVTLDAWTIALALFGDTPGAMQAAVIDLWSRNLAAANPGAVPAGTYSVLPGS